MRWPSSLLTSGSSRFLALALVLLVALVGCQIAGGPVVRPAQPAAPKLESNPQPRDQVQIQQPTQAQEQTPQAYTAKLQLTPSHAQVGATVAVQGSGYAPNSPVELVWYTVDGRYDLEGGTEFVGGRYAERAEVMTTIQSDQSGAITTSITVPLDFGGMHDLRGRVNGQEVSQAGLTIDPTFSLTPTEGPIGTPIELKIVGVDYRANINTWHVLYDNKYLGLMTAVQTRGVAVARFRATGPLGERHLSVWHNSFFSIPYLNWYQGPYKDVPGAEFSFRVTADQGAPAPIVENFSATDNPWPIEQPGSGKLNLSVDRGSVGQATTLRGSSLPPNTSLSLRWWTMVGNRVSATGFIDTAKAIDTIQTGSDGTFVKELTIPDDLGGQHRLDVALNDQVLAATGLVIQPSLVSLSSTRVREGEQFTIHLKGVGWTTYDNTYTVTYDNSYIGYVCGFNTNGDVLLNLTATGAPGTHIIDLYPTIYKGKDAMPRVYSIPQLTYADDHPQRITPALRLAIEIVE